MTASLWQIIIILSIISVLVFFFKIKTPKKQRTNIDVSNSNYFQKLWYGEIRLVVSYWVWGVLGTYAMAAILGFLSSIIVDSSALFGLIFLFAYMVIVSVAIWRSSDKYEGSSLWQGLAKFAVIIGWLITIIQIYSIP